MTEKMEIKLLKEYAQVACIQFFGFAPAKKNIVLLESHFNGNVPQYVMFSVNGNEFQYDGITMERRCK